MVIVRAHDSAHGFYGALPKVPLHDRQPGVRATPIADLNEEC
jgi:hypothetical protein